MRSILVPITDEDGLEARLQAALDLARATNGHVTFLHAEPASEYVAPDPFGGSYYVMEHAKAIEEATAQKRARAHEMMANEDVPWGFAHSTGTPEDVLVEHSRLADVVVLTEPPTWGDEEDDTASVTYLVMAAQCPVLAVPEASRALDCTGKAVIAWNGSQPAANAVRAAVPMLALAGEVEILTLGENPEHFPAEAAAAYLSRHGINAEIVLRERRGRVSEAMHDVLEDRGAAWLVMGAYGHSRMRELVFGGVTRHFIQQSPVPVLLTH